jgi:O-antigen ligase
VGEDLLEMYAHTYTGQKGKSIGTLGNLNFFSSYVCMYTAVAVILFLRGKWWYWNVFYAFFSLCGFCGLLVGNSDSGFLGIGLLLLIAPMLVRNFREMAKYFAVLALFFLSGKVVGYFFTRPGAWLRFGMSSFTEKMVQSRKMWVLAAVALIAAGVCLLLSRWKKGVVFPGWGKWIWFGVLAVAGVILLMIFVYFSVIDRQTELGKWENYFRFSDWWGTHRGYAWRVAWQEFCEYKGKDLWVGTGADTATHLYLWDYYQEMMTKFGAFFENVHNEYLQYLVTLGILGVGGYVVLIVSGAARSFWRQGKASPAMLAAGMAVACYAVQGIVNISQTMTTRIFFVLLGVAEGAVRNFRKDQGLSVGKVRKETRGRAE